MASTYSTNLKIELMATGSDSGTWGTNTNTNLGTAIEQAIIGYGNPDYTSDANLTITITNSSASQAARCLVLNVTSVFGSLTATRELIVPTIQKQYIVQNNTTGGQSITVKTSAGTGITVPTGRKAHLYVDGTNVIQMFDFVDINGGTIDGATVGAASASTGAFTSLTASGATTLNGTVALGDAAGDLITVPGTVNSNLIFTDNLFDIGATGATRPRNLFLAGAATVGGNLSVGGTLTLTGGVNLNGNVTVGDSSADTLTINSTITSNLIFTDNTYDIGASGATRPRSLFLAGNITAAGNQTLTGALTVDSTTDSSSTTTGSIQTDGGVGIAKALFVGTTVTAATLNLTNALGTAYGGTGLTSFTSGGVVYASSSSVLATGSTLVTNGSSLGVGSSDFGTAGSINVSVGVVGTTTGGLQLWSTTTGQHYMQFGDGTSGSASYAGAIGYNHTSDRMDFYSAGALGMSFNLTGLGIGTSAPAAKLVVASGNTLLGHNTLDNYGGNVDIRSAYQVRAANTPTQLFVSDSAGSQTIDTGGAIDLGGYTSTLSRAYTYARIQGLANAGSGYGGYLSLMTTNAGGSVTERVRIATVGTFIIKNDYQEQTFTANSSTAITLDIVTNGTDQVITLTGTATITMPTATAGKSFLLKLKTGAGAYTVTWTTVKWPGGTAPTLTSTASRMDIFSFFSDGTNWYGCTVGQNYTP